MVPEVMVPDDVESEANEPAGMEPERIKAEDGRREGRHERRHKRRHGADQLAARRPRFHRIHCMAAGGRESGMVRGPFMQADSSSRYVHVDSSRRFLPRIRANGRITAGLAALSET
jgi:hypothetical protein